MDRGLLYYCCGLSWLSWWRHQMETFSVLLALCVGNSSVAGEFPAHKGFDVFFHLRLNKWLSKQSWGWWLEIPLHPLWCHCNAIILLTNGSFQVEAALRLANWHVKTSDCSNDMGPWPPNLVVFDWLYVLVLLSIYVMHNYACGTHHLYDTQWLQRAYIDVVAVTMY